MFWTVTILNGMLGAAQTVCLYISPRVVDSAFYVFTSEGLKLCISAPRVPLRKWSSVLFRWEIVVLAFSYALQNGFVVLGKKLLPPSVAAILSQLKIVTTFFFQLWLSRAPPRLIPVVITQAVAMALAVILSRNDMHGHDDRTIDVAPVFSLFFGALLSALNAVATARLLKGTDSFWPTNFGLSTWGCLAALIRCSFRFNELNHVFEGSFELVTFLTSSALLGAIGLLLSLLLAHTSPLTKVFSSIASIGISMVVSGFVLHDIQSVQFYGSCLIVVMNTFVYSLLSQDTAEIARLKRRLSEKDLVSS